MGLKILWTRRILLVIMTYIAIAFPARYPDNVLTFTYLSFLVAFLLELSLWVFPIKDTELTSKWTYMVLFQCSWTSNSAVALTTIMFFLKPDMIKTLNLPSTLALIEILAMHYTPTIIHMVHLYEYPHLYKVTAFLWTLVFPIFYYIVKNIIYFIDHEVTLKEVISKHMIIIFGPILQYLAQGAGILMSRKFSQKDKPAESKSS